MARRHKAQLKQLLEDVAYNGYAVESKEFFLRAYGAKQQRFTVAVREYITEEWEEIAEEVLEELNWDLTQVELKIAETPKGMILVARDNIFWD